MNQSQRFNQSNRKGFTRQEHLSFYLSDPKLKPSTRKVSPNDGEFGYLDSWIIVVSYLLLLFILLLSNANEQVSLFRLT